MDNQHTQAEELLIDKLREDEILAMTQRMRALRTNPDPTDEALE